MRAVRWIVLLLAAMIAAPASAQTLIGWNDLSDAINRTATNNIESLNGRRFEVRLENTTARNLVLTPPEAFSITKNAGSFTIEIVNARALVRSVPGFTVKVAVGWEAKVSDETQFPVSIEGVDQCIFSLTFRQVGGEILDLSQLSDNFDVKWTIDNPSAVATTAINGRALTLTRKDGNNADVSVRLHVRSNDASIDVTSQPVALPKCGRFLRDTRGEEAIVQLRTPGQCVVQTYYKEDGLTANGRKTWDFVETYANGCDRPVRCNFRWFLNRFLSAEDGLARRNPIFLNEALQSDIFIQANGYTNLTAKVSTDFVNAPYYSYGKLALPDGAIQGFSNPDVVCRWAS